MASRKKGPRDKILNRINYAGSFHCGSTTQHYTAGNNLINVIQKLTESCIFFGPSSNLNLSIHHRISEPFNSPANFHFLIRQLTWTSQNSTSQLPVKRKLVNSFWNFGLHWISISEGRDTFEQEFSKKCIIHLLTGIVDLPSAPLLPYMVNIQYVVPWLKFVWIEAPVLRLLSIKMEWATSLSSARARSPD